VLGLLKELAYAMDLLHNCYSTVSHLGLIHYLVLGLHYADDDMGVQPHCVLAILLPALALLNAHRWQTVGQKAGYR